MVHWLVFNTEMLYMYNDVKKTSIMFLIGNVIVVDPVFYVSTLFPPAISHVCPDLEPSLYTYWIAKNTKFFTRITKTLIRLHSCLLILVFVGYTCRNVRFLTSIYMLKT